MIKTKVNFYLLGVLIVACITLGIIGDGVFFTEHQVKQVDGTKQQITISQLEIVAQRLCNGQYVIENGGIKCK